MHRRLRLFVLLFPSATLVVVPLAGARATVADLLLAMVVVAGVPGVVRKARTAAGGRGVAPRVGWPVGALAGYATVVLASGAWGFHPAYALVKGAGVAALVGLVVMVARDGPGGLTALVDTWLEGAGLALVATLALLFAGEWGRGLVTYSGGASLAGLPRLAGTFGHPNLFGEWLVATGVLLWARWPAWRRSGRRWMRRRAAPLLAVLVAGALPVTASTAWASAGVALLLLPSRSGGRAGASALRRVVGGGLLAVTLVGVLVPVRVGGGSVAVTTSGLRPDIWASAAEAVRTAPALGVGAAPYLAAAPDPGRPGTGPILWDAHSLPLSLLGQFGVVGFGLFVAGALPLALRPVGAGKGVGGEAERLRLAVAVMMGALAVQSLLNATEDMRHAWLLLGMAASWEKDLPTAAAPDGAAGRCEGRA